MRGKPGTQITLTIKREGVDKPLVVLSLTREIIKIQVVKSRRLDDDIGYIRLTQLQRADRQRPARAHGKLKQQAGGKLQGLVLDLRNNPGGLLDQAVAVSDDFLNDGEIVSTRARHPDDSQRWNAKAAAT